MKPKPKPKPNAKRVVIPLTIGLTASGAGAAHIDVLPYVRHDKLLISKIDVNTETPFSPPSRVFFEELDPSSLTTSAPGFNAIPTYPLPPNTPLSFTVVPTFNRDFSWWGGSGDVNFAAPADNAGMIFSKGVGPNVFNEALYDSTVSGPVFGYTRQNGAPTSGLGGTIDTSDSTGFLHKHLTYLLRARDGSGNVLRENLTSADGSQPADGVYLLSTQLSVPNYPISDTYYTLLSLNAPDALLTAQDWVQHNLVEKTWVVDSDGAWPTDGNWSNHPPDESGATANFTSAITRDRTVTVNAPVTVGAINFNNAHRYTVAGNGTIQLAIDDIDAQINVVAGSHTIAAPLAALTNTDVTISNPQNVLTLSQLQASTAALSKTGDGTLMVNSLRFGGGVSISAGTIGIIAGGGNAGVGEVAALAISSTARLDLGDNKLIIAAPSDRGTWNGSSYTGVTGLIQSGRNGGNWSGATGIVTSQTAATQGILTSIGVASAAQAKGIVDTQTSTWAGQTVTGSDTLVMYTYGGDANLDGKIDISDYGRIDFNIPLGVSGWYNGDFNYDGKIDISDYGIIDFDIGIQGPPLLNSELAATSSVARFDGATAVPEPSAALLVVLPALLFTHRRRRGAPQRF